MHKQYGMALLVTLVVLVVALLLGITGFKSSLLEERMAANHRFTVTALQTSEAGINYVVDHVVANFSADNEEFCEGKGITAPIRVEEPKGISASERGPVNFNDQYGLDRKYAIDLRCENEELIGYSRGWVADADGMELAARKLRVVLAEPGEMQISGMLSECGIDLNGQSSVVGMVHSNCWVDIKIKDADDESDAIGSITASGNVTLNNETLDGSEEGACTTAICASSNVPELQIPQAIDYINLEIFNKFFNSGAPVGVEDYELLTADKSDFLEAMRSDTPESHSGYPHDDFVLLSYDSGKNECSVDGVDLQPNENLDTTDGVKPPRKTYYCPGDLNISGDFRDVAVISEGDLTHNGKTTIGSEEAPSDSDEGVSFSTFVVSGGSIELNGTTKSENLYATYLAQGEFRQNGNAKIFGSIVSGGLITGNGGIDFEALPSGDITKSVPAHFRAWDEIEDPGGLGEFDLSGA